MQLGNTFKRFFKDKSKHPQFRKKASMIDLATLCTGEKIQAPKPLKNKWQIQPPTATHQKSDFTSRGVLKPSTFLGLLFK
ncbi:hypothetical protein A7456_07330 [Moraxella nonliquefaciens]|uniref:Uncharacterized protein n=1 Tax=Moraxella nonliquefaciens TaxID=478 RepID=A0A1B8QSP7_MORNO|nr:hypothetical protein A7456_07330 [Moraxella nonliquefaciens]